MLQAERTKSIDTNTPYMTRFYPAGKVFPVGDIVVSSRWSLSSTFVTEETPGPGAGAA